MSILSKMVLLFTKRVLAIFGAVLFTLLFDAEPAHGVDKIAAIKNCENGLKSLEQQKCRLVTDIKGAYGKTVQDINAMIVKLKASNEPQIILSLSKDCQDGLAAIDWLIARYGKPAKVIGTKDISAPDRVVWLPPSEMDEPVKIQEEARKTKAIGKFKRRAASKRAFHPKLIKVNKRTTIQKSISSAKVKTHKPTQSSLKAKKTVVT